jgi:hypothetical protein
MDTKIPKFIPCLGVVSVYHLSGHFSVCSTNQLDYYREQGWKQLLDWKVALKEIKGWRHGC